MWQVKILRFRRLTKETGNTFDKGMMNSKTISYTASDISNLLNLSDCLPHAIIDRVIVLFRKNSETPFFVLH